MKSHQGFAKLLKIYIDS